MKLQLSFLYIIYDNSYLICRKLNCTVHVTYNDNYTVWYFVNYIVQLIDFVRYCYVIGVPPSPRRKCLIVVYSKS